MKVLNFFNDWDNKIDAMFWRKRKKIQRYADLDRRREPRSEDRCTITLTPQGTAGLREEKALYYGRVNNASPSGLGVDCDVKFPVGSVLFIKLQSPRTQQLIKASAEVRWVQPAASGEGYELGLEFVNMSVRNIMDLLDHIYKA